MINSIDLDKYIELYQDFLHPNPNINSQAFLILKKEFEVKFMNNLLANLKEEDLFIRRKSILALGRFGEKAPASRCSRSEKYSFMIYTGLKIFIPISDKIRAEHLLKTNNMIF